MLNDFARFVFDAFLLTFKLVTNNRTDHNMTNQGITYNDVKNGGIVNSNG